MIRVVILQHRLLHYRLELFSLLRRELFLRGIELLLVHGQASRAESLRKDEGVLSWAIKVKNKFFHVSGKDVLWQPYPVADKNPSLVILMQENKIISNYILMIRRFFGGPLIAYWGHGKNLQSTAPGGIRERWKAWLLKKVDWWFAYTSMTVDYVSGCGYPTCCITNLENSIDISGFQRELDAVSDEDMKKMAADISLPLFAQVGVFCGSLYPEKRIDLLLESADLIKQSVPDFHLIVIGDGPSAQEVRDAAASRPWIHCTGVRKGREKAVLFRFAKVQINPGAVGLHVLDAFAAGLPMITTKEALHGPEIAYLRDGLNGVISNNSNSVEYAGLVVKLLLDGILRDSMSASCRESANHYTVENMVNNFCDGIVRCLEKNGAYKR